MAVHQISDIQVKRASISLLLQPVSNIKPAMTTRALALEKLSWVADMNVFQELLDLDSPNEHFSKEVVGEFLIMAESLLSTMHQSLNRLDLSKLNTSSQSLRCAALVLGLTRIEKACSRIETILSKGVDLHHTGMSLRQICETLSFVIKEAHAHFELARIALSSFYGIPKPCSFDDASDTSVDSL